MELVVCLQRPLELAFSLRIAVGILGRIIYVLRVVDHAASQQLVQRVR